MRALDTKLEDRLDEVVKALVRDVAAGVHAMYRGDIRQQTAQVRMSGFVAQAREALLPLLAAAAAGASPTGIGPSSVGTLRPPALVSGPLTAEEAAAITRCVMAWGPMGTPSEATSDSRCVPGAKELAPSWGEREKAREAIRRVGGA